MKGSIRYFFFFVWNFNAGHLSNRHVRVFKPFFPIHPHIYYLPTYVGGSGHQLNNILWDHNRNRIK